MLGQVEAQDRLVPLDLAGRHEPVVLVEPLRTLIARDAARQEDLGPGSGPQVGHDRIDGRRAVAATLAGLVDEEAPEVVRAEDVVVRGEVSAGIRR